MSEKCRSQENVVVRKMLNTLKIGLHDLRSGELLKRTGRDPTNSGELNQERQSMKFHVCDFLQIQLTLSLINYNWWMRFQLTSVLSKTWLALTNSLIFLYGKKPYFRQSSLLKFLDTMTLVFLICNSVLMT